jgi:hypothetical protein
MQKFTGRRFVAIVFVFAILANSFVGAHAQTAAVNPTVINVTSQIQQANVARLGVNMEDHDYWDSGQLMKDLIFTNPGFEAEQFRSIFNCASVTANTCTDTNAWSPQPANFWQGATYLVNSGAAAGTTGTVLSSTAANNVNVGQVLTFDKNVNVAKGDYIIVTAQLPGNGQNGWWTYTNGNGTIVSETTDISPNSPGKQALRLNAPGVNDSVRVNAGWDASANRSFLQMNGNYQLTFRAKAISGSNQFKISIYRLMAGEAHFIDKTVTLSPTWQDYTVPFTASENGTAVGGLQLDMIIAGGTMLLDDVALTQTNGDPTNTTAFRDDVVNTLKQLKPGVLRMYGGNSIGTNLYDEIAPPFARYPEGSVTSSTVQFIASFGVTEFLQLCQAVGADPWITIPTATTPQEMTDFMDYLVGDGSTKYSAIRVAAGQTEPWTSVFNKIHIEFGNETWNASFQGEIMSYPAYPLWANQVFGAARQAPNFDPTKFDLVLSGFAASPGYTQSVLQYSTQHDSIDVAPYLMFSANNDTLPNLFNALFAEPEMFDSPGGEVYQNLQAAQAAKTSASGVAKPTGLNVYEVNMSTFYGTITQAEISQFETSLGAGIALADHMLQMMRLGVAYQNVFGLTGWQAGTPNGNVTGLYGTVMDMGPTNIRRPSFLAEALANTAIQGDMLQTQQTGANPTYNEPLSSDNVQYNGVHEIQSFAFAQGQNHSLVLFNLNQTTPLPVTFTGPNAPTGTVQVGLLNSANITDNNETADVVQTTTNSLSSFNPATPYMLPAHSMTVLSWTAPDVETTPSQAATPVISLASGTYPTAQSVTISEVSPAVDVYYTTDGSTPTTSSNLYTGPITVSNAETLNALAIGPNYVTSSMASASYAIAAVLPSPLLTPAGGTYSTAQTVTLTATPGTTIYYTTNGSIPNTSSTKYTGPFTVSSTQLVAAIAVAPGYPNSAAVTASYVLVSGQTSLSYPNGFTPSTFVMNGGAKIVNTALQLTDGGGGEARSVWTPSPVPVSSFITDFSFQIANPNANGFTFTVQNSGTNALGGAGGSLGYQFMAKSVALKFDFYNSAGEGNNSTGVYTNGASPTVPATDLTPTGVSLQSGHLMQAHVVYDGTYLTLTLTDTVTKISAVEKFAVNIPATVGAKTAYLGFTASTGGLTASQTVFNLTHVDTSGNSPTAVAPVFSVPAGSYPSAQTVAITDLTPGAVIHYTTDGSTPTAASATYSGPLTVSATETINAIAVATGYSTSGVSTALYTISQTATAPPALSIASGTYTGAQTVSISDATSGAVIYYTTDGSTPTTSSSKYVTPLAVGSSETLKAIAVSSGHTNSTITSAAYVIQAAAPSNLPTGTVVINYANGFTAAGLSFNGGAIVSNGVLQLTDGGSMEGRSAWYSTQVPVNAFTTDFTFQNLNALADGFTFTIQGVGVHADGNAGGSLGYQGIGQSVAVKFDLYSNSGEGSDSTGIYVNGAAPTVPATDLTATGVNLHSQDVMHAHITYDGSNLVLTLTDTVTNATAKETFPINIPQYVGSTNGYVGFTGGTGGKVATQNILTWTYMAGDTAIAVPVFSPAPGTYTTAQNVTITDATPGVTIYYTTDGTTPTSSSPTYTAPIMVSSTETVQAIAVLNGSPAAANKAAATVKLAATATTAAAASSSAQSSNSVTASYTILANAPLINYSSGFTSSGMAFNGGAAVSGKNLVLTDGNLFESRSAWYTTQVPVDTFTTDFTFQLTNAVADGFTFTLQDVGTSALGEFGAGLGYAGMAKSVAVKFDLYNNSGEGADSTGIFLSGAMPTLPSTDLSSSGINLHSGDVIKAHLAYDGATLTLTLTDTITNAVVIEEFPVNIPAILGGKTGYVGFTAGSGGAGALQQIQSWTYAGQ